MTDATVTPIQRDAPYTDAALNDIHVLLTASDPGDGALADIAVILARTGRPMIRCAGHRDVHDRDRAGLAGRLRECHRHVRVRPAGPGRGRAAD